MKRTKRTKKYRKKSKPPPPGTAALPFRTAVGSLAFDDMALAA